MGKLMLCTNLDCPLMYSCVRSMKPLEDKGYSFARFNYDPKNGCSVYLKRVPKQSYYLQNLKNPIMEKKNEQVVQDSELKKAKTKKAKEIGGYRPKPRQRKKCMNCDKGFLARENQVCCSEKCSKDYYYKRKKEGSVTLKRGRPKKIREQNAKSVTGTCILVFQGKQNGHLVYELIKKLFPDSQPSLTIL